ncbi:MAG: hypothetical protein ACYC4L_11440 [Chloroflexota bacterium]
MDAQELLDAIAGKPVSNPEQQQSTDKELSSVKGQPQTALTNAHESKASDAIYLGEYNAVSVQIICIGTTPVGTITVQGAPSEGGNWNTLPDPQALQSGLSTGKIFDVLCGQAYLRISLSAVTGTYGAGQGWTVKVTPYMAPGQAIVTATANQGAAGAAAWPVAVSAVTAAKLTKGGTPAEEVTCTLASTDYPAAAAMPAGTKYVVVCAVAAFIVAMGEETSATIGVFVGPNSPTMFPVTVTGTAADDTPHCQSATAGAVVRFTYMKD